MIGTFPPLRMYSGVFFFSTFRLNKILRVSQVRKKTNSASETNEKPQHIDNQPPIVPARYKLNIWPKR